jgi:hypothetical protein
MVSLRAFMGARVKGSGRLKNGIIKIQLFENSLTSPKSKSQNVFSTMAINHGSNPKSISMFLKYN